MINIPDCNNVYTGKAKDFNDYCKSNFDKNQQENIDKAATQIQIMGEWYNDYEKIQLAANPYAKWVNSETKLADFYEALKNYYEKHKSAPRIENPNCADCPKYPVNGDAYWDNFGRNWFFMDNKWKDLSGEFCSEEVCFNEWKQGLTTEQIQLIHREFYNEELSLRINNSWQQALGGTPKEFEDYLWRMTQFATIEYLKELWVNNELGRESWIPIWGNIREAGLNAKVANGDMTFYTKAGGNLLLGAADFAVINGVLKKLVGKGLIKLTKEAVKNELSILKSFFGQKKVIITMTTAAISSAINQAVGNYCLTKDYLQSIMKVDVFDALTDGMIAVIPINGYGMYQLFGKSSKIYIYDKASRILVLEFAKASIDVTIEEKIVIRDFFNNDIDAYNTFALFVISMASENIPAEDIVNELVIWSRARIHTYSRRLEAVVKPIFEDLDELVNSNGFKKLTSDSKEILEQIVSELVNKEFEKVKLTVKCEKVIKTDKSFEEFKKELEK